MPRFFVQNGNISDKTVKITDRDAFHIARSLRMAVGDTLTVADNNGREYECRLTKIRDEECECEIIESRVGKTEPPVKITLFMGYPKGDKLETVIQKAVELGCAEIIPFESSRCIKRPKQDRIEKQNSRLSRIAEEAAKQCGRGILPEVLQAISFKEMLDLAKKKDLGLFCYEGEGTVSLKSALRENKDIKTVSVTVGCEGGFSEEEAEEAKNAGLISVNLGPRILRCETAPTYALAAISYELEL